MKIFVGAPVLYREVDKGPEWPAVVSVIGKEGSCDLFVFYPGSPNHHNIAPQETEGDIGWRPNPGPDYDSELEPEKSVEPPATQI